MKQKIYYEYLKAFLIASSVPGLKTRLSSPSTTSPREPGENPHTLMNSSGLQKYVDDDVALLTPGGKKDYYISRVGYVPVDE